MPRSKKGSKKNSKFEREDLKLHSIQMSKFDKLKTDSQIHF